MNSNSSGSSSGRMVSSERQPWESRFRLDRDFPDGVRGPVGPVRFSLPISASSCASRSGSSGTFFSSVRSCMCVYRMRVSRDGLPCGGAEEGQAVDLNRKKKFRKTSTGLERGVRMPFYRTKSVGSFGNLGGLFLSINRGKIIA